MIEKLKQLCLLLFMLGILACSKDVQQAETKHNYSLLIEGSVGSEEINKLKSVSFYIGDDIRERPAPFNGKTGNKFIWKKGQEYPLVIVLKNKRTNETIAAPTKGIIDIVEPRNSEENSETQYRMMINTHINLSQDLDVQNDEWIATGIVGGRADLQDKKINFSMPQDLVAKTDQLDIPIMFPWSKVAIAPHSMKIKNVQYRPIGCLVGIQVKSKMAEQVFLKKMEVYTNAFTNNGSFDISGQYAELGQYVPFKNANTLNYLSFSFRNPDNTDEETLLVSPQQKSPYFYTWVMPVGAARLADLKIGFEFDYPNPVGVDATTRSFVVSTPENERWQLSEKSKNITMQSSKSYALIPTIQSNEPIISEFYYNQTKGHNYTMVEIYNPSTQPVDLSQYYFVRMSEGTPFFPYNPYYGFHGNFSTAVMLPLVCKNGEKGWRTSTHAPSEGYFSMQCEFIKGEGEHLLPSQKTAIYGASGYITNARRNINDESVKDLWTTYIIRGTKTNTLFVGADNGYYKDRGNEEQWGGVLQLGQTDGIALIKYIGENVNGADFTVSGHSYKVVDTYSPYMTNSEEVKSFKAKIGNNKVFYFCRKPGVIYPNGRYFNLNQWDFDNKGVLFASPGSRYRWWKPSVPTLAIPDMKEGI